MAEGFIGEIRMFGGNYAPKDWSMCDGQTMSYSQQAALAALLGDAFGGDGRSYFKLPDFRGRIPVHSGDSAGPGLSPVIRGQRGGVEHAQLPLSAMPAHNHDIRANAQDGGSGVPTDNVPGKSNTYSGLNVYATGGTEVAMAEQTIGETGQGVDHENMMPYIAVTFIICMKGNFPSRN